MLAVADNETPAETAATARDMARTENRGVVTIDTLRYLVVFVRAPVLPEGGATLVQGCSVCGLSFRDFGFFDTDQCL